MGLLSAFFRRDPLLTHYKIGRRLGKGTFATVKEATEKTGDKKKWAVKIIDKRVFAPEGRAGSHEGSRDNEAVSRAPTS